MRRIADILGISELTACLEANNALLRNASDRHSSEIAASLTFLWKQQARTNELLELWINAQGIGTRSDATANDTDGTKIEYSSDPEFADVVQRMEDQRGSKLTEEDLEKIYTVFRETP